MINFSNYKWSYLPQKNRLGPNCFWIFDHFTTRVSGAYLQGSQFVILASYLLPKSTVIMQQCVTHMLPGTCAKFSTKFSTVGSLKHPWSSPKNFRFRRCRRSNLDQNLPRITNPVSDLTGDQYAVVLCDFSKSIGKLVQTIGIMEADFGKCSHLREKGGLYGQNLPYKFKKIVW